MSLYFELGNTNLKAAIFDERGYRFLGSIENQSIIEGAFIDGLSVFDYKPNNIYLISVASAQIENQLINAIKNHWQMYPHILKTEPECCGIENGYDDFSKLGVDRWMALLALHSNKPYIVVDAGTALTLDAVIDKKHQGGFIVPGLGLMLESLEQGTYHLTKEAPLTKSNQDSLLATNTEEAIYGGNVSMLAHYINSCIADLELETGRKFECYGTGGDFALLQPLLNKPFEFIEDLTLLGMVETIKCL